MNTKLLQNPSAAMSQIQPELAENYDVYVDSNVAEARLVEPVLVAFGDRIKELLAEWPENPILEQLLKIILRLLSFPLSSPILKITTGLELLLRKGYDWEAVAHKGVSIVTHLDTTRGLVARWRRMELDAWKQILNARSRESVAKAQKWWFHLHELTRKADSDEGLEEEDEEVSEETKKERLVERANENFGLLDDFVHSSTLGDFEERLTLMESFQRELELSIAVGYKREGADEFTEARQEVLLRLLYHIRRYYAVFLEQVKEKMRIEKAPIEDKLQKFAKLSRWDIGDYNHLVSTSEKSHRTIGKCARDFDAILLQKAAPELQVRDDGWEVECDYEIDSSLVATPMAKMGIPQWAEAHPPLPTGISFPITGDALMSAGLVSLTAKMRRFREKEVAPNGGMDAPRKLTLGVQQVREFVKERASCWRAEEIKRSMKQKSLTDTFKLLTECGLSHLTTHRDAAQLEVAQLFASLPTAGDVSCSDTAAGPYWVSADNIYYHCIARMVSLRHATTTANKDVTRREVLKATGVCEHLLTLCTRGRSSVASLVSDTTRLLWTVQVLQAFEAAPTGSLPPQEWLLEWLRNAKQLCDDSSETLEEARLLGELAQEASAQRLGTAAIIHATTELAKCKKNLDCELSRVTWLKDGAHAPTLLSQSTLDVVKHSIEVMQEVGSSLDRERLNHPGDTVYKSLKPIISRIVTETAAFSRDNKKKVLVKGNVSDSTISKVSAKLDSVIGALLISFQKLRRLAQKEMPQVTQEKRAAKEAAQNEPEMLILAKAGQAHLEGVEGGEAMDEEDEDVEAPVVIEKLLTRGILDMADIYAALNLGQLNAALAELFEAAGNCAGHNDISWLQTMLCQLRGALMELGDVANAAAVGAVGLQHEMVCLEHTLASLFQQLFAKGFAKKQEEDTTGDGERGTEDCDGTGLGEGSGVKDISDELNDEEQIEGLKQDKEEEKNSDEKEESKPDEGVEMTNDFEGDLEDFKPPPDDETKDEDEKEDEKEEVDRDMGDVGDDGETVDQKAWDKDEDNDDMKDQKDQKESNAPTDGPDDDVEIQAKEDPDDDGGSDKKNEGDKKDEKAEKDGKDKPEEQEGEEGDEGSEDGDEAEDGGDDDAKTGEEMEDQNSMEVRQEDDFELPEDMDLDEMDEKEGDVEEGEDGEDGGDDMDADESKMPEDKEGGDDADDDDGGENDINRMPEDEPDAEEEKEPEDGTGGGEGEKMDEDGEEEENDEEGDEEGDDPMTSAAPENNLDNNPFGTEDDKKNNDTVQGADEAPDQSKGKASEAAAAQQQGQQAEQDDDAPPGASADQNEEDAGASGQGKQEANPMRSLGEVAKHWERRLNVQEKSGDPPPPKEEGQEPPGTDKQYEFMDDDDDGEEDTQVLAPATDTQAQEQAAPPSMPDDPEDLKTEDEKKKEERKSQHMKADEDEKDAKQRSGTAENSKVENKPEEEEDVQEESEEVKMEEEVGEMDIDPGENEFSGGLDLEDANHAAANLELDVETHRQEIDRLMQAWREGQNEAESADDVWRHFESLTGEYSRELCEMLRLVLEPTLATRLQGGYRTGKRIDMKKVIPYIASDFRKDRIWMRRTKPSKRQYQVMVAVDGSKSMQENGAGQLALEALVLISRALARLEVGEIGVVRFGEDVDLVHPFEQPFSDAAGAKIIQKFDFTDENTDVLKFMSAAVPMLDNARNSGGGGTERVQIVFVISDAVFSNREACREWVSAAAAKNQLIVFIIVDNSKPGASVLERKSFQFNEAGAMQKVAYMDSFPFPYYIVLRNIATMPQALGDALRQWFELLQKI